MGLVFSNAGVVRNINVRSTVTLKKDILVSCGKVTNHNVSINSNVHRCINVCYLNEFLGSVLVNKSVVSNSNVLANRSATASHKRNLTERNSDRSTFAAKTPVCKGVISDGKRLCICDICRTLFYSDRIVLSIADLIIIDKKCKSVTNSDTYFCAVNNVAGDSSKESVSVGNNVNRILINVIELTVKNTCILKVDKSKTLTLEYDTLNGYRAVVGYRIIITDVETTGKSSAVICSALDSDALATESVNVVGNLDFLCNSTCKKLNYIAVNRSIDSLGNGFVSGSADLCYCNKCVNVAVNVAVATVCTGVSCVALCIKGRSSYNRVIGVTERCNLVCSVAVTAVTCICCISFLSTCRSSYNCIVRVTECLNKLCITYSTDLCCGTGSSRTCGMTLSRNYHLCNLVVASCTVLTCSETDLGTCCINCLVNNDVVTESCNLTIDVSITASTCMCGITIRSTCGSSYNRLIDMNVICYTEAAVGILCTVKSFYAEVGYVVGEYTAGDLKSSLAVCVGLVTVNCTYELTALNVSSTAYDTLVAGKVVVPVVNCKCGILIGYTVIYDVTTLNSKSTVYANGNLLICSDSTLALNSKSLVDTNKYERIARVIVITLSGRNCITVKVKNKCTSDLAVIGGLNIDVLGSLNVLNKGDSITAYCCIKCFLKSLILSFADLCYCNESSNVAVNVAITTLCTGVSCVTLRLEGRSSYNRIIGVTESYGSICLIAVTTYTGVSGITAVYTIGSSNSCFIRVFTYGINTVNIDSVETGSKLVTVV